MPSSPRRGFDRGTCHYGPLRTRFKPENQTREFESEIFHWSPRCLTDHFEDFDTAPVFYDLYLPLMNASDINLISVANATTSIQNVRVPRGGVVTAVDLVVQTALAAHDTNFLTFKLENWHANNNNAVQMFTTAAAGLNTTKITGGTALAVMKPYAMTLSATAGACNVAPGDVLMFTSTAAGTLANTVHQPMVRVRIQTVPSLFIPAYVWTAGVPQIQVVSNSANGELLLKLEATNEEQMAMICTGDQLCIDPTKAWLFNARVKTPAAVAASVERFWIGLGSALVDPPDSITYSAWFKCDGSLALVVESDDNTTDTNNLSAAVTLTASKYYNFFIDGRDLGNVKFWLDDNLLAITSMKDIASTNLMQPFIGIQKDSGVGVNALTVDYVRWQNVRF